jgi:hypothetical protein
LLHDRWSVVGLDAMSLRGWKDYLGYRINLN